MPKAKISRYQSHRNHDRSQMAFFLIRHIPYELRTDFKYWCHKHYISMEQAILRYMAACLGKELEDYYNEIKK